MQRLGQIFSQSPQATQRGAPSARATSAGRPRKRSGTGRFSSGYSSVTGGRKNVLRVSANPFSRALLMSAPYERATVSAAVTIRFTKASGSSTFQEKPIS